MQIEYFLEKYKEIINLSALERKTGINDFSLRNLGKRKKMLKPGEKQLLKIVLNQLHNDLEKIVNPYY